MGRRSSPKLDDAASTAPSPAASPRWAYWLLVLAVVIVFGAVVNHGFGPVDDPQNISQNPKLNPPNFNADGVLWYWKHAHMGLYIPVTYTVWGLLAKATWVPVPNEEGIFLDARIFHAASLLAHVLSVLAVYAILRLLLRRTWPALAGALLFGLHPLQVESVAWTAGLKDVLYGMFSLTAIWLYLRAVARVFNPCFSEGKHGLKTRATQSPVLRLRHRPASSYVLGIVSMIVAMLCKPTAMVTPLLVALIDLGIMRRPVGKVFKSAAPWFLAAIPLAVIAKLAQPAFGIDTPPLWQRPIVAGASLSFYLSKLVVPIGLTFDYGWEPIRMLHKTWFWTIAVIPVVLGVLACRSRWLATAGLIFIIALLPVLGFVPFLFQFYSTVADHYLYLAMLGPAIALAWGLSLVPPQKTRAAAVAFGFAIALLSGFSMWQLGYWSDEETILYRMLAITPQSLLGHNGLGNFYQSHRHFDWAESEYNKSLAINPLYLPARAKLLDVQSYEGRADEAIAQIYALMELHERMPKAVPADYSAAFYEVGRLTMTRGRYADAVRYFVEDVKLHPDHAEGREALREAQEKLREATTKPTTRSIRHAP